jgi:hypothetical protein
VLEAEPARRTVEVERRGPCAEDGYLSVIAWLVHRLGVPASAARSQVRLGRSLQRMPGVRHALLEGEIAVAAALLLADAQAADPKGFERSEQMLLELARTLSVRDLTRAVEHWKMLADPRAAEAAAERRFVRRALFVSPTLDGMVRIDGDLDPETGQTLITALGSMVDRSARGDGTDPRTPAQRRADALGEICRSYLDSSDRPVVAVSGRTCWSRWICRRCGEAGVGHSCRTLGRSRPRPPGGSRATRPLAGDHTWSVRAARGRNADPGRAAGAQTGRRGQGRRLPVPRMREASALVRRAPRRALGRRR